MNEAFKETFLLRHLRLWDSRCFAVLAVCIVIACADFYFRVSDQESAESTGEVVSEYGAIGPSLLLTKSAHEAYLKKLTGFGIDLLEDVPVNQSLADSNYWRSGLHKFRLLAVFMGDNQFAVIDREMLASGESEVVEVREGDVIDGFKVNKIASHSITLKEDLEESARVELFLFEALKPISE